MKKILIGLFVILFSIEGFSQVIDKIEAVIGNELILTSDIESQYLQYLSQGYTEKGEVKCQIIQDILYQKLLTHQAKVDSVEVSEKEVNKELERRLSSFISQLGSQEAMEEYFGKSILEVKEEFYDEIENQLLSQRMQSQITSSISVTPQEVRNLFDQLKKENELPLIPSQIEISQVVKIPEISLEEKSRIRKKLINFRERINKGEDFKVLATLYSDDIESAKNGGELGFVSRGDLVTEFEAAAFALKGDEISEIVETSYGYHIIQLIERRGEQINVRHILMKAKVSSESLLIAKQELEKINTLLKSGELTFEEAAKNHSDDVSKNNGGLLINPSTSSSLFTTESLPDDVRYSAEKLEEGEISSVNLFTMNDGTKAYRIIKINKKIEEHTANLTDDYSKIHDYAVNSKKQLEIVSWIDKMIDETYIRFEDLILECELSKNWIK
ncbi:MAG: peptidylprolyl isomerase [Flavobacteriales bacterium]|jgi:peptidyl-prolyl cis-trans isomerase SurA|nr:peptidylprolyl isomerase [Flavobacteriales bacterium]MBT6013773.1 peptidylprolyl isomerase [Flavobacteriales bacterium]MBT7480983.1 peptidylprolyl isomerase [Flavobacteriales bacterium]